MCADTCVCAEKKICRNRCCSRKHRLIIVLILGFVFALAVFAWIDASLHLSGASDMERSMKNKMQVVFLANDQIYFGVLSRSGPGSWILANPHYLERSPDGAPTRIKKLAEDMHMPENAMYISDKNILFWQNLQNTSPITQTIIGGK